MTLESKSGYSKSMKEKHELKPVNSKSSKIQKDKHQQKNADIKKHKTSTEEKNTSAAYSFKVKESKARTDDDFSQRKKGETKKDQESATVSTSPAKKVEVSSVLPGEEDNFKVTGFIGPLYKPGDKKKSAEGLKTKKICSNIEKKKVPSALDHTADHLEKLEENVQSCGQVQIDDVLSQFYKELDEIETTTDFPEGSEPSCSKLALSQAKTGKPEPIQVVLQEEYCSAQDDSSTFNYEDSQSVLSSNRLENYSGSGWQNSMSVSQPVNQPSSTSCGLPVSSFRPEWQHPPSSVLPEGHSVSYLNPSVHFQSPSVIAPPPVGPLYYSNQGYEGMLHDCAWSREQLFQNNQYDVHNPLASNTTSRGPSPVTNPEHAKHSSPWHSITLSESGQKTYCPDQRNHHKQHLNNSDPDFNILTKGHDSKTDQDPRMYSDDKTSPVGKDMQENDKELQPGIAIFDERGEECSLKQNLAGCSFSKDIPSPGVQNIEEKCISHSTRASNSNKSLTSDSLQQKDCPFQNDSGQHLMVDSMQCSTSIQKDENYCYHDKLKQNSPVNCENRQRKFYAAGFFGYYEQNNSDDGYEVNPWMDSLKADLRKEKHLQPLPFELDDLRNLLGEDIRANSPCFGIQNGNHANEPSNVSGLENLQNDAEMHYTENSPSVPVGSDERNCSTQCPGADDPAQNSCEFDEKEVQPWMESLASDLKKESLQNMFFNLEVVSSADILQYDSLLLSGQNGPDVTMESDKENCVTHCFAADCSNQPKQHSTDSDKVEGIDKSKQLSCDFDETGMSNQPKQSSSDLNGNEVRPWMESLHYDLMLEKTLQIVIHETSEENNSDCEHTGMSNLCFITEHGEEENCSSIQGLSADIPKLSQNSSNTDTSLLSDIQTDKCSQNGVHEPNKENNSENLQSASGESSVAESPCFNLQSKAEESCIIHDPSTDGSDQPKQNIGDFDEDEVRPWMYSLIHELKNEKCLGIQSQTENSLDDTEDLQDECNDQSKHNSKSSLLNMQDKAEESCSVQDPSADSSDKPTENSGSFDEDEVRPWMYSLIHELKNQTCFSVQNETDDGSNIEGLETKCNKHPELKSGIQHETWPFELWQEDLYHYLKNHPGRFNRENSILFSVLHSFREKYLSSQEPLNTRRMHSLQKQKNPPEVHEETSLNVTVQSPRGSSCSVEDLGSMSSDHQEPSSSEFLGLRLGDPIPPSSSESGRDKRFTHQRTDSVPRSREDSPCYDAQKNDDCNFEDVENSLSGQSIYKRSKIHENRKRPWVETLSADLLLSSLLNLQNDSELNYEDSSRWDSLSTQDLQRRIQALLDKYMDEPSRGFYGDSRRHPVKPSDFESICGSNSDLQNLRRRQYRGKRSVDDSCITQLRGMDYSDFLENTERSEVEFVVSKARRRHSSADQGLPKYERGKSFSVHRRVIIFMRGVPGSGKSTLARSLIEDTKNGVVLSTDDYFSQGKEYKFNSQLLGDAHDWNQNRAEEAMEQGKYPIVIDNTNIEAWEMKPYVEMALKRNYDVEFLEPDTWWKFDPGELEKRNTHQVPREKIAKMVERFSSEISIDIVLNSVLPKFKTNPRPSPLKKRRGLSDTRNSNRITDH
ncbi:NEDD4-binding protein 2-like 2 [Protopterus annectens]|uniref:NEDD4-binding protein 2-like 2 n=1 Tax=Protopterus annectens TaxID=7888 RepID=UPI001CFBAF3F|nr:NEDD4-binding protein 2-like 2 [Protopterus annectens]XP_043929151.1 NEDD4-binding protein 2-like 2 [Protopterus annectens]